MRKQIRKIILWSFDKKPTYSKAETVLSNGVIKMNMAQVKLDRFTNETQIIAVNIELNLIKWELETKKTSLLIIVMFQKSDLDLD